MLNYDNDVEIKFYSDIDAKMEFYFNVDTEAGVNNDMDNQIIIVAAETALLMEDYKVECKS